MQIEKFTFRNGGGPFIRIPLAIPMEVWAGNFRVIRIPMRRPAQIKPDEHNNLPCPVLMRQFCQINSSAPHVEQKLLPPIR